MGRLLEEFGNLVEPGIPAKYMEDSTMWGSALVVGSTALIFVAAILYDRRLKRQRRAQEVELEHQEATEVLEQDRRQFEPRARSAVHAYDRLSLSILVGAVLLSGSIIWGAHSLGRSIQCAGFLASELGSTAIVSGPRRESAASQSAHAALTAAGCS